ncbi:MAG: histidine phosphatase family protein [Actinomycetota bacterium]
MSDEAAISQSVHLLRHGQVENPKNILYGRQPGWKLSERGHEMAMAVAAWSKELSLGAIHASPLDSRFRCAMHYAYCVQQIVAQRPLTS